MNMSRIKVYEPKYVLTERYREMSVKYTLLTDTAKRPTKGSERAAGWDLYADTDKPIAIEPGQTVKLQTGIAMAIPSGYFGAVYTRSGIATKRGLRLANCVGVIDSDYRGDISVPLHNDSNKIQSVQPYERIAQIVIQPYMDGDLEPVEKLDDTARGEGGFGSTGTN